MKIVVGILLLVVVAAVAIDNKNKYLRDWYMETLKAVQAIKGDSRFYQFTKKLNLSCITRNMNFNTNKDKNINFADAMILIYGSGLKCLDEDKRNKVWELMIDSLIEKYNSTFREDQVQCFKKELKRFEPQPQYVTDFDESSMTLSLEECEKIVDMDGLDYHIKQIEAAYGSISVITKGRLDADNLRRIMLTFVVLGNENEEIKTNGRDALILDLKDSLDGAFGVVLYNL
ncbi:hypothetical protein ACKWTF_014813 [Chironomus riparius]